MDAQPVVSSWSEALGHVLTIAFEPTVAEVVHGDVNLDVARVPIVIKPYYADACWKFPGGMLEEPNTFRASALRELREETGVCMNPDSYLMLLYSELREQHEPFDAHFEARLYAAFGCDFSGLFNPCFNELGDEGEVTIRVPFGEILQPGKTWEIPTEPGVFAPFLPSHLELLGKTTERLQKWLEE